MVMTKLEKTYPLFFSKVERRESGCWEWTGFIERKYGKLSHSGKLFFAHRFSWMIHKGAIPENILVCHKCDNPICVNPKHLWLGSHSDNNKDRVKKGRSKHYIGEENRTSKLTEKKVIYIRSNLHLTCEHMAKKFGVSTGLISHIRTRRAWKHVK